MGFTLTAKQEKLLEVCRRLSADFATRAAQHDREASLPLENYEALKREGFYELTIPTNFGGGGAGLLDWVLAVEELAQGCPSTALSFTMHAAGVRILIDTPTTPPAAKQRIAQLVAKEHKLFASAFTEPGSSSLLIGLPFVPSVQARRVNGGYMLQGRKAFTSMGEASDYLMLMVHPQESSNPLEMLMLLGPYPAPGLRVEQVWDTLGMRGTQSNNFIFEDYFVPEENFCFQVDNYLDWVSTASPWVLAYGTVYLGVAAATYHQACETLKQRTPRGFAQPLSYHPQVRSRVAEMSVDLEAARLLTRQAAWLVDTEGITPASITAIMRAKYFMGEATARITRTAVTACGAHALFKTSPLEQLYRDGSSAPIMPPSSDACLDAIGLYELGLDPQDMLPPLKLAGQDAPQLSFPDTTTQETPQPKEETMKLGVTMFATDYAMPPDEFAKACEDRGFESVWFPEHTHIPASRRSPGPGGAELTQEYWHSYDLFVAMTAAAAATQRIKIGSGICLAVERDPIVMANEVASVDQLSKGRVILGIGGGWNAEEMENHGTPFKHRWKVLREKVEAMKEIWTNEAAEYHGEFVNFDPIWSHPKPFQKPHPPIILGTWTGGLHRVVRYCDGWMPVGFFQPDLAGSLEELRNRAEQAGRSAEDFPVTVVGVPDDEAGLRQLQELGVQRGVLLAPSAESDQVLPLLDKYAALVPKLA